EGGGVVDAVEHRRGLREPLARAVAVLERQEHLADGERATSALDLVLDAVEQPEEVVDGRARRGGLARLEVLGQPLEQRVRHAGRIDRAADRRDGRVTGWLDRGRVASRHGSKASNKHASARSTKRSASGLTAAAHLSTTAHARLARVALSRAPRP